MEGTQRKQIKAKILEEIQRLEQEIPQLEKQTRPIPPDPAIGRLSRMEAIGSKSIQEASLRKAKHTLSGLKTALTRIDREDFGQCRDCEEPIPLGRLLAMPEQNLCVPCAARRGR